MKDFTLEAYKYYLQAIKSAYQNIMTFAEFFCTDPKPESFCLIRHDVDRRAKRALPMARLENELGVRTTYYFRAKPHVFKPEIIKEISHLGHEIGYHYESLSDTNGDAALALRDFENNLKVFREIVQIKTISGHGRPLKPFDNLGMWQDPKNHRLLLDTYGILGEVYLDIDYGNVGYINDTGRNWVSSKSNKRDRVSSYIQTDFRNGTELYDYLKATPHSKIIFQVHPERWTNSIYEFILQWFSDQAINIAKKIR